MSVFSAFSIYVVALTPRFVGISSIVVSWAASRGWASAGLHFMVLVLVEGRIQWVRGILRELLVIRQHGDWAWRITGIRVGTVKR